MKELKEYIRSIPDFPEKGIIFRDVTSVLQDADALKLSHPFPLMNWRNAWRALILM